MSYSTESADGSAAYSVGGKTLSLIFEKFKVQCRETVGTAFCHATAEKVGKAAGRAFLELAFSFTLSIAVLACFATPLSATVVTFALLGAFAKLIIKVAWEIYCQQQAVQLQSAQDEPAETEAAKCAARLAVVNLLGISGPNIAIHECGHALGAVSLFQNAEPRIQIFPFSGGQTSYSMANGLTRAGKILGQQRSFLFVAAAGMMASAVFAMLEFGLAHGIKESHPTLSEWMNYHAISQLLGEVLYGASAFAASQFDLGHDFMCLWSVGDIHPLIPIALIIALPLAEICLLNWLSSRKKAEAVQDAAFARMSQV